MDKQAVELNIFVTAIQVKASLHTVKIPGSFSVLFGYYDVPLTVYSICCCIY